jgi:hypothetical protein
MGGSFNHEMFVPAQMALLHVFHHSHRGSPIACLAHRWRATLHVRQEAHAPIARIVLNTRIHAGSSTGMQDIAAAWDGFCTTAKGMAHASVHFGDILSF